MGGRARHWPLAVDLRAALPPWLVARAVVALAWMVAAVAVDELTPGDRPYHLRQGLFAWDGTFYRDITAVGYEGVEEEALRFFPLVPILARVLAVPLFGNTDLALVLVSNGAALVAAVLLHRLVLRETGDRGLASRAVWLMALLPPAMVLVLGYAESTLMALSIAGFLALRRGHWGQAGLLGLLVGLSRPIGVVFALPVAIEAARGLRSAPWRDRLVRAGAVVAPVAGMIAYLAWVGIEFADWRLPLELQASDELRGPLANPVLRAATSIGGLFGDELLGDGLHAPWIILYAALVAVAFRRLPASYGAYAAVLVAIALSSSDIGSFERYGLSAFPILLALASVVGDRPGERMVLTACAGGLAGFSTLAFLGTFVP